MKNEVIINKALEAINNIDMNDVESLISKYNHCYGVMSNESAIEYGYYSQEAVDFVNEHLEDVYCDFYSTYIERYVIPAAYERYIEEGETEEDAQEIAEESADDMGTIYMSVQNLFAEYVYDAMQDASNEMAQVIGDSIDAITDNLLKYEEYYDSHEWSFTEYTEDYDVVYNVLVTWNVSEDVAEVVIDTDDYKQPDYFNGKVSLDTVAQTIKSVIETISETKSVELV